MSGISKRVSGSWVSGDYGIMGTSTDTITTLPVDLYPNDTTATVGLKGQMQQTGSPTPQNPIQPSECGDLETVGEKAGQYKIPISSASTTTPVYLGEVETTRRIKRLVLTGEETWTKGEYPISDSVYHFYMPNPTGIMGNLQSWIISHFVCGRLINGTAMGLFFNFYPQTSLLPENPTANDFKAWIAAQYAAGTPVTIWYVLAEPETGIVNEPIRKIGNYADTVSGITIPTIAGADSFDVLTTLKPSEVTANYHGWHTGAVHECDSGQWD